MAESNKLFVTRETGRWIAGAKRRDAGRTQSPIANSITGESLAAMIVKPTAATANGVYTGKVLLPTTADISSATPISAAALGTEGGDCIILNLAEIDSTGAAAMLTPGRPKVGRLLRINNDGTPVVVVDSVEFTDEDC